MMDIELSIIIVSFNTKDLLRSCLQSICSTITTVAYEIIVVDNNSKDGSPKMIENEFKDLRLIKNEDNYGFAKANNQAIKIAKGKYLLLLNSDTILIDGAIENLNKFIDEKPNAAAVGPKVINFDETLQSKGYSFPSILLALITFFRFPKFLSEKKIAHWFPKYFWNENDIRQVDWISGCCMLIRREVINKIGMLSEDFLLQMARLY